MNIPTKKIIIWGILLLTLLVLLVKFSGFLFLWMIFTFFSSQVSTVSGIDIWLSRAILALTVVPIIYLARLMFSVNKRKRMIGQTIFFGIIGVSCLAIYLNSQGYQPDWEVIPGCLFLLIGSATLAWIFWTLHSTNKNKKR